MKMFTKSYPGQIDVFFSQSDFSHSLYYFSVDVSSDFRKNYATEEEYLEDVSSDFWDYTCFPRTDEYQLMLDDLKSTVSMSYNVF